MARRSKIFSHDVTDEKNDLRGCLLSMIIGATSSAVIAAPISYFAFQGHWMLVTALTFGMGLLGGTQQITIIEAMVIMIINIVLVTLLIYALRPHPLFLNVVIQFLCGAMTALSVGVVVGALNRRD